MLATVKVWSAVSPSFSKSYSPSFTKISSFLNGARQCAAVSTCVSDMRVAPQYWPEPRPDLCTRAASHGHSSGSAGRPPTILVWNLFAFTPHSLVGDGDVGGAVGLGVVVVVGCVVVMSSGQHTPIYLPSMMHM